MLVSDWLPFRAALGYTKAIDILDE